MSKKFDYEYIHELLNNSSIEAGLYIIATPIGNLSDITIRALNILASSKLVYCEDTRVSKKLTSKYGINCKLKPFHKFNSKSLIPEIIRKLENNEIISLISDAGTPLISDPGYDLINKCIERNIQFYSIPGASSVIGSLIASGMPTNNFTFLGFIPRIKKDKKIFFEKINSSLATSIFYESPKRVKSSINLCSEIIKNRKISIVRELTKKNEEIIHGDIIFVKKLLDKKQEIKGEITIIIEPTKEIRKQYDDFFLIKKIEKELTKNKPLSQISTEISDTYNVSKRRVYQLCLDLKDKF
jgi:16S rRNA (cytidine1402-2'-O)-methyltransferase